MAIIQAAKQRVGSLNGLRGIAVLIVILSHTSNNDLYFWGPLNFSGSGQYGVMIFFFLSAFLLSRPFFRNSQLIYKPQEWVGYIVRRILRIIPLYYIVLIFDFYVSKFYFVKGSRFSELTDHFIFVKGYNVFWTMPVEMKFYLMLPFLIIAIVLAKKRKLLFRSLISVILLYFVMNAVYANSNLIIETLFIHRYLPCFLGGVLTSYFYSATETRSFSQRNKILLEVLALACILFFITQLPSVWTVIQGNQFDFKEFPMNEFYIYRPLVIATLIPVFVYCYLNGMGIIKKILSSGIMMLIGNYSYGMYLTHYLVIDFLARHSSLPSSLKTSLVFFITFIISVIAYHLIEKPFIKLAINISKRLKGENSHTKTGLEQTA